MYSIEFKCGQKITANIKIDNEWVNAIDFDTR